MPKRDRDAAQIMMFSIYVDDSGSGRNGPVFLLAACESSAAKWAEFSDRWDAELKADPPILYFKASECFAFQGQFQEMSEESRNRKAENLASIFAQYVERVFLFKVNYTEFDAVFFRQIDSRYDEPYFLMAQDVCDQILGIYRTEMKGSQVEIIFDNNDGVSRLITELYHAYRENFTGTENEYLFTDIMPNLPVFGDETRLLPLQAADLAAWFFRRIFSKEVIKFGPGIAWDAMKRVDFHLFDADKEYLLEHRQQVLGMLPEGSFYFHQLEMSRRDFDLKITEHNIEALKNDLNCPTLHSFSSKQMRRRRLVKKCKAFDMPHLHTQDGKKCLLESVED